MPEEETTVENTTRASSTERSPLPPWYPSRGGQPIYHGNAEALGFCLDSIGRAVGFIGAAGFLGTALLNLAKEAAGCETQADAEGRVPDCDGRVYGIRPSSLLTTYTMVVGLVSAIGLPWMGAIVDYTPHRRKVARLTSVALVLGMIPQLGVHQNTWELVAALQIFVAFMGWAQTVVSFAYLPELTESEEILNTYTQSFNVVTFAGMVLYLAGVVAVATAVGLGDIGTARLGLGAGLAVMALCLYGAWGAGLMQPRPPARPLPVGQSVWTAGFVQIYQTAQRIHHEWPSLQWFYVSVAFIDAGINSLATIMITYLTDTLNFTSTENGLVVLLLLIGSIPGAWFAGQAVVHFLNPIQSAFLATTILAGTTVTGAIVLQGPGQQLETYALAVCWGIGTGWKWTNDRLLAAVLVPPGQDAELMGVYLFAGQVLTWMPPLVFTILNEVGVSQRVGIGTFAVHFGIGGVALCWMGDYRRAVDLAKEQPRNNRPSSRVPSET